MSEWATVTLADIADIRFSNVDKKSLAGEKSVRLCNYMDAYSNNYITADLSFMEATATALEMERFKVEKGDNIITKDSETPDDIGIPAVVIDDIPNLICGYHLALIKPKRDKVDPIYLSKQLGSKQSAIYFSRLANGSTRYGLSSSAIASIKIPLAPFVEQRRIADVLFTLDKAIKKTEALIAKYQQIKAGLMHDLFTRGVTADGKLRPPRTQAPELYHETSIGWVPKEWGACPIASLLDRIIDYRGKTPTKTIEGIPLITAKNVRMGFIDSEPREFIAERDYPTWMTRGIPINTDVVFTTEAPLGNVAQVGTNEKVAFAQRVIILQPGLRVLPNFLRLLLMTESFQRLALRLSSGSTALGIKQSEFRKIMVGHPVRLDEQQFISDKLIALENCEAAEADKVEKLHQQKSGLMHDLLTGRVRVPLKEAEKAIL